MSWMSTHFICCEDTVTNGDCGDATEIKQDQILQALADLQVTVDATEACVDEIKASTVKPEIC